VQSIVGVFRIIGRMENATGLEHDYRHQKRRAWLASPCPAGAVIISQGPPNPAAPLGVCDTVLGSRWWRLNRLRRFL
jgi:hypothetical protein